MILPHEILKPAKHGFVIDLTDGERRVHVRVFEFERQELPGAKNDETRMRNDESMTNSSFAIPHSSFREAVTCEMPVSIDEGHAIARLRQAMECLRETALARGMTKSETRMRNADSDIHSSFAIPHSSLPSPPVLGDVECCEKEGGIAP